MSEHNQHDSRPQWPSSTQQWPSQQPGPRPSGQAASWLPPAPGTLSAQDAEKSRKWRTLIGISSILLAAFAAFFAVMEVLLLNGAAKEYAGYDGVPQALTAVAVLTSAAYGLGALAYLGVGIWNLVLRRTISPAPLIGAIVLAGIAVLLIAISLAQSTADGRAPQFGGLVLNTLVISRAIIILRLKKVTAHARAAH